MSSHCARVIIITAQQRVNDVCSIESTANGALEPSRVVSIDEKERENVRRIGNDQRNPRRRHEMAGRVRQARLRRERCNAGKGRLHSSSLGSARGLARRKRNGERKTSTALVGVNSHHIFRSVFIGCSGTELRIISRVPKAGLPSTWRL